ncbi:unnamed protein product [Diabrotica balteata]|uniref:Uncharacterized protein n=1 Tax=Diabrotica balteata TaxID=107213 RepID=A0A9N9T425_DIABA|nr:unnamed protein product [Diabrotica balteata]
MAVICINAENSNDEFTQYQMGRYVSSNEAIWRMFSFSIHERHPTVVHLAVHLENGQRVYFTAQNAVQRAAQTPSTTLTSFLRYDKTMLLLKHCYILKCQNIILGINPQGDLYDGNKEN